MASLDGLQGGLKELLGLSRRIQQYVRAVQSGKARALQLFGLQQLKSIEIN